MSIIFKILPLEARAKAQLVTELVGFCNQLDVLVQPSGLSQRVFLNLLANPTDGRPAGGTTTPQICPRDVAGVVELLGFSRIDDAALFRAFRDTQTPTYDPQRNTFGGAETIVGAFSQPRARGDNRFLDPQNYTFTMGRELAQISIISDISDHMLRLQATALPERARETVLAATREESPAGAAPPTGAITLAQLLQQPGLKIG